ncbi:MAG TPA: 30S ribosome-binding factor RbfA [Clostridiales bacterium]|jgi:ribosome-binding factor A|nr:30S ribosome-binding factor RbfA [Clostridiales bacterium]
MNIKKRRRLEEDIKRFLSQIIHSSVKDPRINEHLTITEVSITDDMKYAKVFVSVIGTEQERKSIIEVLAKAKGFIRKELSGSLSTRYTPDLSFILDEGTENTIRINQLLRSLEQEKSE